MLTRVNIYMYVFMCYYIEMYLGSTQRIIATIVHRTHERELFLSSWKCKCICAEQLSSRLEQRMKPGIGKPSWKPCMFMVPTYFKENGSRDGSYE